jgi:hypothetical protein
MECAINDLHKRSLFTQYQAQRLRHAEVFERLGSAFSRARLRAARTCYDPMAGAVAVALHDRFKAPGCLTSRQAADKRADCWLCQ